MPNRSLARAALCLAGYFATGCAVSLGPGYTIQKQTLHLHYVPAPQPHFAIRASFELKNSGNQPLQSIRVQLPPAAAFHRALTTAQWNGHAAELQTIAAAAVSDPGDLLELRLPESWTVKQNRTLVLHYELTTGSHLGSFLAAGQEMFFAYPDSFAPVLLRPKHLFGTGGAPPKKWTLAVHVPAGYLVQASGKAGKRASSHQEWTYPFVQQPHGFAPFAAGGKFVEREVRTDGQRVLFWTLQPVDPEAAQRGASSIAARARYYETEYGSPTNEDRTIRLLECVPPSEQFGCGALPQTLLVPRNWVARGLADPDFCEDANFELAYTWFGGASRVRFDESPLPADALAPYAAWEARANGEGGVARAERIRALIADFDKHIAGCKDKVVLPFPAASAGCSYSAAWTKSGLFYFALEDKVGRTALHSALRGMMDARQGRDFSLEDLIAAVDANAQQPQGPFVRSWLKHSGIPDDFRARYAGSAPSAQNSAVNPVKEPQP